MKIVILCGGLGTRLAEETQIKPKPMVEIGGRPILWHIMNIYSRYGYNDFILALGYKGDVIKNYFMNYHPLQSDLTVHLKSGKVTYTNPTAEDWRVSMIDTGTGSMTGGRLLRLKKYLEYDSEGFMLTYGDGLCDVNISNLLSFHKEHGKIASVTAVKPSARFGGLTIDQGNVTSFKEKPQSGEGWINGGFFVFNKEIFDYIESDQTILEKAPIEQLVEDNQFMAYQHPGYWQCMDTIRDRDSLQAVWDSGNVPWLGTL